MDALAQQWIDHLTAEHTTANTIAARVRVLRSVGNPGTATREDIEAWWSSRADLSPATRANDLACLRSFYKWAARWEHRLDDPTLRLDAPRVPNGMPRPISRADLHRLLDGLEPDLRRAVCLGAYGGVRVAEAASIDWTDIDTELMTMRVTGKGNKTRIVPIGRTLLDSLLPDTGGNVVTAGGPPYSASTMQRKINRAIRRIGVDATFHQLRHRFGTIGYQATGDLLALGRMMGHSSPVTTQVYAQASDDAARRIADAVAR